MSFFDKIEDVTIVNTSSDSTRYLDNNYKQGTYRNAASGSRLAHLAHYSQT